MTTKRIIAALLAALLLPALSVAAGAAVHNDTGAVTVYVGTAGGAVPGSSTAVSVPVGLEADGAYEAHSLDIVVEYDPDQLTVKSAPSGAYWSQLPDDATKSCDFRSCPGKVFITVLCPTEGFSGGGVLKNLNFVMNEGCTQDQPVTVSVNEFVYYPVSGAAVEVPYVTENGAVQLIDYDQHDVEKLLAFLNSVDEYGFSNGIKVDASYTPYDPRTWGEVLWTPYQGALHISAIAYSSRNVVGTLDLEDCVCLQTLDCDNNKLTGLALGGCSALEGIDCRGNKLTEIDLSGCPLLSHDMIRANGGGTVGYFEVLGEQVAAAVPDEGYTFAGWYDAEGALISNSALFDSGVTQSAELVAVFASAQPPVLLGDVNLDGEVTFADVSTLYGILTGGGGNVPEESMLAADLDGNGEVTFADVSALYDFLIRG